jgi:hypothetical protein
MDAALEAQYVMTRVARDRGWGAVVGEINPVAAARVVILFEQEGVSRRAPLR